MNGILRKLAGASCLLAFAAGAQSPVVIKIDDQAHGRKIPSDFSGLSFESSNLLPGKDGKYLFSAENKPLINLFRTIGIKDLRVGGGTADGPEFQIPGPKDIDHLFEFARAAGINIIYTVRLLNGNVTGDAAIANYIQQHYASELCCFQIGNEPDWHSFHTAPGHPRDPRIVETMPGVPGSAYPSYLATWKDFAEAIRASVPNAQIVGPDTGSNYPVPGTKDTDYKNESWTQRFAEDEKGSPAVPFVTQHDYVGESAAGVGVQQAIDAMLSPAWVTTNYRLLYDHVLAPVQVTGLSYRMTECNDYTGGVDGASNAFASALWALDYMHWHASHGAVGINFHNKSWIYTDTIYLDKKTGEFRINPKAYAIKVFDLGSHGNVAPLTLSNPDALNLTAYAVHGEKTLYVTLINKEHGRNARAAAVTILSPGAARDARIIYMTAPNEDPAARTGITLGGASIVDGAWEGKWTSLKSEKAGLSLVNVPAASAAVVKFTLR